MLIGIVLVTVAATVFVTRLAVVLRHRPHEGDN
jgi:hypothetical protein